MAIEVQVTIQGETVSDLILSLGDLAMQLHRIGPVVRDGNWTWSTTEAGVTVRVALHSSPADLEEITDAVMGAR